MKRGVPPLRGTLPFACSNSGFHFALSTASVLVIDGFSIANERVEIVRRTRSDRVESEEKRMELTSLLLSIIYSAAAHFTIFCTSNRVSLWRCSVYTQLAHR
jgi:hypothetical protein